MYMTVDYKKDANADDLDAIKCTKFQIDILIVSRPTMIC